MGIVILVLFAAALFGVGTVVEGLAWAVLVAVAFAVAAAAVGYAMLSGGRPRASRPWGSRTAR